MKLPHRNKNALGPALTAVDNLPVVHLPCNGSVACAVKGDDCHALRPSFRVVHRERLLNWPYGLRKQCLQNQVWSRVCGAV